MVTGALFPHRMGLVLYRIAFGRPSPPPAIRRIHYACGFFLDSALQLQVLPPSIRRCSGLMSAAAWH